MSIKPKLLLSITIIFSVIITGSTFAQEAELLKNAANIEDIDEELNPKQVQKLIDFVGGDWKELNVDELKDEDLERLTKIAVVKAGHFNYRPKKHFGVTYKKNRNRKNRMAKRSRSINQK